MNYDLTINQHNIKPHLDIERDIQQKKEGLFTFQVMVSQGNIESYAQHHTVTVFEYQSVSFTAQREPSLPRDTGERSEQNAVRPDKR